MACVARHLYRDRLYFRRAQHWPCCAFIAYGDADVMVAGGAEKASTRWALVVLARHVHYLPAMITRSGEPPVG